jgi:phenylacetate-CoA ligase
VPAGELGRVIVTDLWSHAMPLIRYDLGDIATMAEECACGWKGPVLTRIEGRTVETLYGTDGSRISAFAINGAMRDLEGVIQFQFVQHDLDRYTVRLCTLPSFAGEEVVKRRLLALLGPEVCLSVEYVDEIPALRSGKRPYIVTEVRPPARATSS